MGENFLTSYIILLLTSLFSLLLLLFLRRRRCQHVVHRLPPGPAALPVIGHLHLLSPLPHQTLHTLARRHGPLMSLRLGSVPCVVASTAAAAKDFLKTHELAFADRPVSKAIHRITYGANDFSFAPYGPYWRFMKNLCMSQLLGGPTLDLLLPVRRDERSRFLRTLQEKAKAVEAVDIGKELTKLTNNVISRMAMGRRCSETDGEAEDVRRIVEETAEITGKFNVADYIGFCKNLDLQGFDKRVQDTHRRFDEMMEGILMHKEASRRKKMVGGDADYKTKDLLDILLDIYDDEDAEMRLTRDNIKAFILDIFVAGTDTTAITTEWALAELINHPDVLQGVREEIDAVVGKNRLVEESDVPNLPYLQAVVKEVLRLHPTGPMIVRESTKGCVVGGYEIPARTTLFVNVWAIGRDPDQWQDPTEFRPRRFLEGHPMEVRGQHYQLLPFGSGRRGCPGTTLAMGVVQSTLAAMVQCFEWAIDGSGLVDMGEAPGLTLQRASPLVCTPAVRMDLMSLI